MTDAVGPGPAIAVVADDLSGAAELAGVGWRRGLSAEVHTDPGLDAAGQLVAVDIDSRSRAPEQVRARLLAAAAWLAARRPRLVFKKTDSVLRGRVRAELELLLAELDRPRALLVPANPSLGRVIRGGRYFVDGRPVHETDFARDPVHPIESSQVIDMLGSEGSSPLAFVPCGTPLPERGIAVGEATGREDLLAWASRLDGRTLPAGAAEFFDAVLERGGHALRVAPAPALPAGAERLLVSGSASEPSRRALAVARARGVTVLPMPDALFHNGGDAGAEIQRWAEAVAASLARSPLAAVAVDRPVAPGAGVAARLAARLAELVAAVLERRPLAGVLAEGGATAAAVIRRLGWRRLRVRRELRPGVVEMLAHGSPPRVVTVKPGSYAWPEEIWST